MCGIAGVLSADRSQKQIPILIQRMQNTLRHRGPDHQGIYISPDQTAALAHTRLAILDLTSAGHQPMSTIDGRYWITFNGEIYNFRELRFTLTAQGEKFHSQTDTEVILKLYQKFGSSCVNKLQGMFAFAIWDDLEKTCFLARDPLGIKPLYYWCAGATLIFASELKSILASGLPTIALSLEGLYGYLVGGSVPEPYTLIQEISCLEAGHWLYWQSGHCTCSQYWQINFTPKTISVPEAIEIVRNALIDSIKYHLISDVPVGVFLSGGIDSTAIVALASRMQLGKLRTYSIAFAEPDWNEAEIARNSADTFGTEHTEYKITASLGRKLLPQFLAAIDQPSIDGFNTFCVSQVACNSGIKVALSGLGGDELFGGYRSFQKVPQMVSLGKWLRALHPLGIAMGVGLETWGKSSQLRRLGDFLQQLPNSAAAYHSFRGIFSYAEACRLVNHYLPDRALPSRQWDSPFHLPTQQDEVSLLEISCYMRNQLLRDSDVMSMTWGLELRTPFVHRALLEAIASIPSNIRLATGKQLLIQAVPELPDFVFNRPKRGFSFPLEKWLSGEWHNYFPEIECDKDIPLNPWYRRWSLSILQHWWEQIAT